MIKIAFCDDDVTVLNNLSRIFDSYRDESGYNITYFGYHGPYDLMKDVEHGVSFDILFLDIIMPGENGIELAKEIREHDKNIKIVFLTSSSEFAVESYSVQATSYILKPFEEKSIYSVLDGIIEQCKEIQNKKLVLKCKNGITTISPDKIEYCEVIGHSIMIHLNNKAVLESAGTLDELEEKLKVFESFLRVHRSYLVNMAYIQNITYRGVTMMSLAEIPIPRGKYNEIKKVYLADAFNKEWIFV